MFHLGISLFLHSTMSYIMDYLHSVAFCRRCRAHACITPHLFYCGYVCLAMCLIDHGVHGHCCHHSSRSYWLLSNRTRVQRLLECPKCRSQSCLNRRSHSWQPFEYTSYVWVLDCGQRARTDAIKKDIAPINHSVLHTHRSRATGRAGKCSGLAYTTII